jgi:hypothetical protein
VEVGWLVGVPFYIVPVIESLKRARARYRSNAALGEDLHMTGESVGRALAGKQGLSAESAVRLACLNGTDHLAALDEAGHGDLADLLRGIYEPVDGKRVLTKKQRQMLEYLESLDPVDLTHVLALVKSLAGKRK